MLDWLRSTFASTTSVHRGRRRAGCVLALERLDERCLLSGFAVTPLISDLPGIARFTDPRLINPWGMSFGPEGPMWFADNGPGVSTVGDENGPTVAGGSPLVVAIPGSSNGALPGSPTGTVFNAGQGFVVSQGGVSGPSMFLFATEEGVIAGWNPDVSMSQAIVAVDNSSTAGLGPVYTGLASAGTANGTFLYAADFRAGTIDVFDSAFHAVHSSGAFMDSNLPADYAPFNIQLLGNDLYVTYTEKNDGRYDGGSGAGNGYVDVFDTQGTLLRRLASAGPLDAPWGVALAPADFRGFGNDLLVGNFGDGRINAFDPTSGAFVGTLTNAQGDPIAIPQLWAISFGNDAGSDDGSGLYFTAGIGNENHGLFGYLQSASASDSAGAGPDFFARLAYLDRSDTDSYPLPPAGGPTLQQRSLTAGEFEALLQSLNSSGSEIIPVPQGALPGTNSAIGTNSLLGSATGAVTSSGATSDAGTSNPATGGSTPGLEQRSQLAYLSAVDLALDLAGDLGKSERSASGAAPLAARDIPATDSVLVPSADIADNASDSALAGKLAVRPADESMRAETDSGWVAGRQQQRDRAASGTLDQTVGAEASQASLGLLLQSPFFVGAALLSGLGTCVTFGRRLRISSEVTLSRIRSLWSRSTRRPALTLRTDVAAKPAGGPPATRVIEILQGPAAALDAPSSHL